MSVPISERVLFRNNFLDLVIWGNSVAPMIRLSSTDSDDRVVWLPANITKAAQMLREVADALESFRP